MMCKQIILTRNSKVERKHKPMIKTELLFKGESANVALSANSIIIDGREFELRNELEIHMKVGSE